MRVLILILLGLLAADPAAAQRARPSFEIGAAIGPAGGSVAPGHLSGQLRTAAVWRLNDHWESSVAAEIGRRFMFADCVSLGSCPGGFDFLGGSVGLGWRPLAPSARSPISLATAAGLYRVAWARDRLVRWQDRRTAALGLSVGATAVVWPGRAADLALTLRGLAFPSVQGTRMWTVPLGLELRF